MYTCNPGWTDAVPSIEDSDEVQAKYTQAKKNWSKKEAADFKTWNQSLANAKNKCETIDKKLNQKINEFNNLQEDYKEALALAERSATKKRKRSSVA